MEIATSLLSEEVAVDRFGRCVHSLSTEQARVGRPIIGHRLRARLPIKSSLREALKRAVVYLTPSLRAAMLKLDRARPAQLFSLVEPDSSEGEPPECS